MSESIEELYDLFKITIDIDANTCDASQSPYVDHSEYVEANGCLKLEACYYIHKNFYPADYKKYCDEIWNSGNSFNPYLINSYANANDMDDHTLSRPVVGTWGKPNYLYYVLSWDDKDNKYDIWQDVFDDVPINESELAKRQLDNLYTYTNVGTPVIHNYKTPGIKTIKSILFSYRRIGLNEITPIRWNFIKSKIFLDLPVNEQPDFSELGSDYKTIPWPYTTLVIGGTDENSKYKISINDTIGGGKLAPGDIIDERFLNDAKLNDELGQSIKKFDLEQVRYFNTGSRDITNLLGIEQFITTNGTNFHPHTDIEHWNGISNIFSTGSSVGEIFINDNIYTNLIKECKLELNCGIMTGKSILDSSGNSNKGLLEKINQWKGILL